LASATSVVAVRGRMKPYIPDAPSYRQKGESAAPITMVEYSDFQCPACRYAVEPAKRIVTIYGKDIRFIFKHFPLTHLHHFAVKAAVAAECAGRQGRFWEFHDQLYKTQEDWAKDKDGVPLEDYAKALGLDQAVFAACLKDPAVAALVHRDQKDGDDHWVVSTPTFFINGKRFVSARQLTEGGIPWIDKTLKGK